MARSLSGLEVCRYEQQLFWTWSDLFDKLEGPCELREIVSFVKGAVFPSSMWADIWNERFLKSKNHDRYQLEYRDNRHNRQTPMRELLSIELFMEHGYGRKILANPSCELVFRARRFLRNRDAGRQPLMAHDKAKTPADHSWSAGVSEWRLEDTEEFVTTIENKALTATGLGLI